MLFRWEGIFFFWSLPVFLPAPHHLCVSAAAKRDRAQSRMFAHGCQPGVICYGRKKRFPSESWEMQPCGRGRGLVDAGRTQLPRETARSFQPTGSRASNKRFSQCTFQRGKCKLKVAGKTDGALTFEQHEQQIVFK